MANANVSDSGRSSFGLMRAPREVLFGSGATRALPRVIGGYGSRVVICCDPVMSAAALFQEFLTAAQSAGLAVAVIADVEPELPLANVTRATAAARAHEPDVVVGFGGGSTIDLAKLLALTLTSDEPLPTFYGENRVSPGVLPVVAVPTTAGTGSEATPVAVVADPDRALKVGVSSPYLVPAAAVVDPDLTYSCPPRVTAFAGIDALTHAIEAHSARAHSFELASELPAFVGANSLSSGFALQAAAAIGGHLPRAVADPGDVVARSRLAYGSLLAGLAFGSSGTHLSHALQYPIGDMTHTPHGLGVGLLLPYVMESCLPTATHQLAEIARAMDVAGGATPDEVAAVNGIRAVVDLRAQVGVPHTLADIGVHESDLGRIGELAAGVSRLAGNAPTDELGAVIESVLDGAWHGRSDVFGRPESQGVAP